jgi:hypothetical protein
MLALDSNFIEMEHFGQAGHPPITTAEKEGSSFRQITTEDYQFSANWLQPTRW